VGALSAVLHFLPYIGPWLAAAGPIALALAAFPGWSELLLTVALFVSLELVSNNVLEPWLYGSSVGLSPFGVVVSAIVWTSLWGIPGLLLATPLTVCLVVAGRYVRGLEYFPVLLGDRPALLPDVRLYQRLLALDLDEGAAVLSKAAAEGSLEAVSDSVVLPVLRRLASDDQRDLVRDPVSAGVRERLEQLLDDLLEKGDSRVPADGPRVLFVPALDESDALAARWLAKLAATYGLRCEVASSHVLVSELVTRIADERPDVICISALSVRALANARHLCKRLAAAGNDRELVVGLWAAAPHELGERPQAVGVRTLWIATAAELQVALESARTRWSSAKTSDRAGPKTCGSRAGTSRADLDPSCERERRERCAYWSHAAAAPLRAVAMTIATPPITASAPMMGGMGIVFVVSAVASMEPMSKIFFSLLYENPW